MISITDVDENLRRDFFIYGDETNGSVFCRYNDNTIRNVKTEGENDNDIRNAPDTIAYPIAFRGFIYLIYPNGEIYKMNELGDGAILQTTNLDEAKRNQLIEVGEDRDIIIGVTRWLNRVWLLWSGPPGRLFYSEINNINNFLTVDDDRETTAGVYTTSDQILAFHTFGNTGLLFTDSDIIQVQVSDIVDVFFSFVPSNYNDIYVGGAISKQKALYYVSQTGISILSENGQLQHISEAIDNVVLRATSGPHNITVVDQNRFIIWSFNDEDNTVLTLDSIDGSWSYNQEGEGGQIIAVGSVTQIGKSFNDFTDENGNELTWADVTESWEFYATTGVKQAGVFEDGELKFFDSPTTASIAVLMERSEFGQGFMINRMSLPEMPTRDWYLEIQDQDYRGPVERFDPDNFNVAHIQNKYSTPLIRFVITKPSKLKSLSRFDIESSVVRY